MRKRAARGHVQRRERAVRRAACGSCRCHQCLQLRDVVRDTCEALLDRLKGLTACGGRLCGCGMHETQLLFELLLVHADLHGVERTDLQDLNELLLLGERHRMRRRASGCTIILHHCSALEVTVTAVAVRAGQLPFTAQARRACNGGFASGSFRIRTTRFRASPCWPLPPPGSGGHFLEANGGEVGEVGTRSVER